MIKKLTYVVFLISIAANAQLSDFKHISFHKADSIAASYLGANLNSIPKLSYLLTKDLETDVEKTRSIFKWIASNITNDHPIYLENKRKRRQLKDDPVALEKWNEEVKRKTLQILLKKKRTVCTGYAFLFQQLCKYAGIKTKVINGFSRTGGTEIEDLQSPDHSWNAVLLNNKWYLCDPTWASGIYDPDTSSFIFEYKEGYFLTEPKLFVKNHYPLEPEWTLIKENNPSLQEFIDGPLLYTSAFKFGALYEAPNKMYNTVHKKESISFAIQLLDSSEINEVYVLLSDKRKDEVVNPKNLVIKKDSIKFDHQFLFKGYYDMHLMLDGEVIMTYAFHVVN